MSFAARALACVALAGLTLGSCSKQPQERQQAAGEVLEGSVSDAMIATDEIRSEPPLAPRKAESGSKPGSATAKGGDGKAVDADPAPPASVPESSPAPAPSPAETPPAAQ